MKNNGIESKIVEREKDIRRQMKENRIREARYNKKYKEIGAKTDSSSYYGVKKFKYIYIYKIIIADGTKTSIRTRR